MLLLLLPVILFLQEQREQHSTIDEVQGVLGALQEQQVQQVKLCPLPSLQCPTIASSWVVVVVFSSLVT